MINVQNVCRLYNEGHTTREIAEILDCGKTRVATIVKNERCSRPNSIRQTVIDSKSQACPEFSKPFKDYIDGLVISDGFVSRPGKRASTSSYSQSCVMKPWLDEISKEFLSNGIENSVLLEKRKRRRNVGFILLTHRYKQLCDYRKKWYDQDSKIVPRDINIKSKLLLKNWVYGDGTLLGNSTLRLCTDSFTEDDMLFLQSELKNLGFNFSITNMGLSIKGDKKLRLSLCQRDGLMSFYEYLGKPMDCFAYKWI